MTDAALEYMETMDIKPTIEVLCKAIITEMALWKVSDSIIMYTTSTW